MNYEKLYFKFVEHFKKQTFISNDYTEVHHVIPRYKGGSDEENNLVRVTYRQHTFLHHLWARITNDISAWLAYKMMAGICKDKRKEIAKLAGLKNAKSGHLDNIRKLANTPERQRKLTLLHEQMKLDGRMASFIKSGNDSWRGSSHTEEFKVNKSNSYKTKFQEDTEYRETLLSLQKKGIEKRYENSQELSASVIENAQRNEEWLNAKSSKSKSLFVSPEGLCFESPIHAAKYYGNVSYFVIENWCKRQQHGWNRIPKEAHFSEMS